MKTTFGALAIGDMFRWRNTTAIQHGPAPLLNKMEPLTKTSETRYDWSKGYGSAEAHYPVTKLRRGAE